MNNNSSRASSPCSLDLSEMYGHVTTLSEVGTFAPTPTQPQMNSSGKDGERKAKHLRSRREYKLRKNGITARIPGDGQNSPHFRRPKSQGKNVVLLGKLNNDDISMLHTKKTYKEDYLDDVATARRESVLYLQQMPRTFLKGKAIAGATSSKPFNFHEDTDLFYTVICLIGSTNLQDIGFDGSISLDKEGLLQIISKQAMGHHSYMDQTYTVLDTIFRSPTYLGRGTFCWLTQKGLAGKESEGTLLKFAHEKGVIMGIPGFQTYEDVDQNASGVPDAILLNRKISNPSQELMKLERIHTRVI
ncbi:hypothetical protein M422DRAFT_259877 [Sphaerobolus stellatus SS14]|uniref:Fungal-type protein kinase domain-containing protein n=1 Tax=Sphaerobolus stellatus (strain SS14) TaxID=990650 RepID=A0A0C9URS2_SPHS4|nr:hypothetical protein M422DRAFT_259877 [Sphaerobolus stellatus SS14]